MNSFHQKIVNKLIEVDDHLYEDRALADKLADGVVEVCKDEFKVTENTSDGYHTFKELYDHRIMLFIALMALNSKLAWWSRKHDDGSIYDGWIIAGIELPTGAITYHLNDSYARLLDSLHIVEKVKAPKWDGHTPQDVVNRIQAWVATL